MNAYFTQLKQGSLAALLLVLFALPSPAATVNISLEANPGNVTMPDGASIPVWALTQPAGTPFAPIPVLTAAEGDTLVVALQNNIEEPVSLVINGQPTRDATGAAPQAMAPVFVADANGRNRVRSFTYETAATGGSNAYAWGPLKPGTYLLQSGSHPAVQIPMGLYAVLVVTGATPGQAYANAGSAYGQQAILLFSEIDPDLNRAVANHDYGTAAYPTALAVGYQAQYFLINGQPWSAGKAPLVSVAPGEKVLLRLLNAGSRPRMPIAHGIPALTVLAEDGQPTLLDNYLPQQHSIDLTAGKTIDAVFTAPANKDFIPVQDRMLGLANGGMIDYIAIVDPLATQLTLNTNVNGAGRIAVTSLPGGINCPGGNCSAVYPPNSAVTLRATANDVDTALTGWSVVDGSATATGECKAARVDCVVTLSADKTVTANFVTNATVKLIAPASGETIPLDASYAVRWTAPAAAITFDLAYSLGPGSPFIKVANRVPGRTFLWPLPYPLQQTATVRMGIIGYDASGNELQRDIVGPFTLQSAILLTAPQAGANLSSGDVTAITWTSRSTTLPIGRAELFYRLSTTSAWSPITLLNPAALFASGASYNWTVPTVSASTTTAEVSLQLFDTAGHALVTDSSGPFSIAPAVAPLGIGLAAGPAPQTQTATAARLLLLLPNGDEVLPTTGMTVLWQDSQPAASYTLEVSADNGATWSLIADQVSGSQFNWQPVPELRNQQGLLLRVSALDADGKVVATDLSDGTFAIE